MTTFGSAFTCLITRGKAHLSERIAAHQATHLGHECHACQEDTVIPIAQQTRRSTLEMVHQVRHLVQTSESGEGGLLSNVGVTRAETAFDFGDEITGHLFGSDVGECAEGEGDGGSIRVVHVAVKRVSLPLVDSVCRHTF